MEKLLTYNHPAVAPIGILIGRVYTLEELQSKFTLEDIKCFFKPSNFEFADLDKKQIIK